MRISRDDEAPEAGEPAASRRPQVLAGVAGFVVGASVIGMLWAVSGAGDEAADDARAACAALSRLVPDLPAAYVSQAAVAPGVIRHAVAARELSAAAADESAVYQDLADHLDGVSRMVISLNFADPAGRRHLAQAQQFCTHV
ncbi:MAG TPA: hypothetical protein VHC18_03755 [Amycolatopsis sp.]|nr:hypothetical protein [Amycolatopsis sp.]